MQLDPRRMAILLAVYRNGGIVAASDTLRISPSAISQQIRLLEKEAGVQLLERTPGCTINQCRPAADRRRRTHRG